MCETSLPGFEAVFEDFGELLDLGSDYNVAVTLRGIVFVVVLVIGLRRPELGIGFNFSNDRAIPDALGLQFFLVGFCQFLLLGIVIENHRTILRADVVSLTVPGGRVMGFPKDFKQIIVTHFRGIVGDLNRFRMTGHAGANLFIAGIIDMATRVARDRFFNSVQSLKNRLGAPKTAAAESCQLEFVFCHGFRFLID